VAAQRDLLMTHALKDELSIWCLLDGKAGHQNQVLGLAEAVGRRKPVRIHRIELQGWHRGLRSIFSRAPLDLPAASPNFIIGAGHATHVPLCVYRRKFGGRSVVLMKPTLPLRCFDICLVPDVHRLWRVPSSVILTKGVLNRVLPGSEKDREQGLFLVGGPSTHYRWSEENIFRQISEVVASNENIQWTVVTSRRTPDAFCRLLTSSESVAKLIQPDDVGADWLPGKIASAGTVWVSEDSVSMTYEALTSGSQVGVLELQRFQSNRVTDCIDTLVDAGYVTRWSHWQQTGQLIQPSERFCEAERCADELLHRTCSGFFENTGQRAA